MASNLKTKEPLSPTWTHVCVDMQQMFAGGTAWAFEGSTTILPNVRALCDLAGEKTVFTPFMPPHESGIAPGRWAPFYERWAEMTLQRMPPKKVELLAELQPYVRRDAQVVDKCTYSPWLFAEMEATLTARNVDTLVISGSAVDAGITVWGAAGTCQRRGVC